MPRRLVARRAGILLAVKLLAVAFALLVQAAPPSPLAQIQTILQRLSAGLEQHMSTMGAAPELTGAKHLLRDWIEARLASENERVDTRAFAAALHMDVAAAKLLCDDCSLNVLGYIDDVRVNRTNGLLSVITAMGLSCGYDES